MISVRASESETTSREQSWDMPNGRVSTKLLFQAEDGIRDGRVTGVQTCALPILRPAVPRRRVPASSCCRLPSIDDPMRPSVAGCGGHVVVLRKALVRTSGAAAGPGLTTPAVVAGGRSADPAGPDQA